MISLHLHRPYGLGSSGKTTGYNYDDDDDGGGDLQAPFLRHGNTAGKFITVWSQLIFTLNKVSLKHCKDKLGRISSVTEENKGGCDSLASTATRYRLSYPEFKPCGGQETISFLHPSNPDLWHHIDQPTQPAQRLRISGHIPLTGRKNLYIARITRVKFSRCDQHENTN